MRGEQELNNQAPTKPNRTEDGKLLVHSIFHTIQGEGPFVGTPSVFVRLAGCNLQCPGCDTEYTEGATRDSYAVILARVEQEFRDHGCLKGLFATSSHERPLIVLTGGEPFRQQIWPLLYHFITKGYRVQIETNGTLFQKPLVDDLPIFQYLSIVCSPKTGMIAPSLLQYVAALKYVAKAGNIDEVDGLPIFALDHPASPRVARPPDRFNGRVYLQPMDEADSRANLNNLAAVVSACKKHGHTLCLQTHKMIGEQ